MNGIELPFSLICSFARLEGIPLKFCRLDGQPLAGAPAIAHMGPCAALLRSGGGYHGECARNHAAAIEMARELKRPFIFHCHVRLAGWAVPVIHKGEALPCVVVCGGALFTHPDSALIQHVERIGPGLGLGPGELARAIESAPVVPRDNFRAAAEFIFELANAFVALASERSVQPQAAPAAMPHATSAPIVFPPARRKETQKAKRRRADELTRRNAEVETVRLLHERRPDEALDKLVHVLTEETAGATHSALGVAETFARLMQALAAGAKVTPAIHELQSKLIEEVLSQPKMSNEDVVRACRRFISIAEEAVSEPRPRQVKAIQKYIEKNLSKKLTLETVGAKFKLREKPLNALILKHLGMSFSDYVASVRVAEARRLLETTPLNVGQIARRTGFKDQSYLTKVFKAHLGVTPTEFREKRFRGG
ncbi:MAG: hypothetical protein Kow0099_17940 [Candidatus Abyssubacteria bacterium]